MKILQTIAVSVLVLGMGSAFAAEPAALNDTQMDSVTSGFAWASGGGTATAVLGSTHVGNTTTATHFSTNCGCTVYDTASTSTNASANGFIVSSSAGGTAYAY